ncbi:hypothetical protein, partial [Frankia sp. AgW1.1]|uniref:hypothetical protein n=1 Tax=Frankia sp. AgW1.1 TaxID=1836971 RepID=UPI001EE41B99
SRSRRVAIAAVSSELPSSTTITSAPRNTRRPAPRPRGPRVAAPVASPVTSRYFDGHAKPGRRRGQ